MVDYRGPQYQFPHRKPVGFQVVDHNTSAAKLKPLTQIVPDLPAKQQPQQYRQQQPHQQQQQQPASSLAEPNAAHVRSRTASSSIFPSLSGAPKIHANQQPPLPPTQQQPLQQQQQQQQQPPFDPMAYHATTNQYDQPNRRTLSNATASTSTTGGNGIPVRTSSTSDSLYRSTSPSPTSLALNRIGTAPTPPTSSTGP